jgi:UDP-3-O-[3-hydroxymyristoyl] glucosamine N-acyltransferase
VIGESCTLESRCFIGRRTKIGDRVFIKPGAVIASEGFGFAMDGAQYVRIPHLGGVEIGDDVCIGANTTIDRAKINTTIIGRGTKIDNLCHMAHNVEVGEDCAFTAQCGVAGSTIIGDRIQAGGQSGIYPHIELTSDIGLGFRAAVTQSIKTSGIYAGVPASPVKGFMKSSTALKQLPDMAKELRKLKKQVSQLEDELQHKADRS